MADEHITQKSDCCHRFLRRSSPPNEKPLRLVIWSCPWKRDRLQQLSLSQASGVIPGCGFGCRWSWGEDAVWGRCLMTPPSIPCGPHEGPSPAGWVMGALLDSSGHLCVGLRYLHPFRWGRVIDPSAHCVFVSPGMRSGFEACLVQTNRDRRKFSSPSRPRDLSVRGGYPVGGLWAISEGEWRVSLRAHFPLDVLTMSPGVHKCNPLALRVPWENPLGYIPYMPVDPSKTKRFAVNLPLELAEKVEALAEKERRSVASWLRNAIEDAAASDK